MSRKFLCRPRAKGVSYLEVLIALSLSALIFAPAYRLAATLGGLQDRARMNGPELEAAINIVSSDLRSAVSNADAPSMVFRGPRASDFRFHRAGVSGTERIDYRLVASDEGLAFARATGSSSEAVLVKRASGWTIRFFNGESWRESWGWNEESGRPTVGVSGLPLAVEFQILMDDGETHRIVVPVMTTVINRWIA